MAGPNPNVDRLSALIIDHFAPRHRELVFNERPVLNRFHSNEYAELVDGGDYLRHTLTYNFTKDPAYSAYEPAPTAAEEQETAARYRWKRNRQHYAIDNGEMLQAQGKNAKFKHINVGSKNSMAALMDSVATQMLYHVVAGGLYYGDASKEINSLMGLIGDDAYPAATITIGQIQKTAARTWWHGKEVNGGGAALDYDMITQGYWLAQDGGMGIDFWICHNNDADKIDDIATAGAGPERYIANLPQDAKVPAAVIVARLKGKPVIADLHATPFVIYGLQESAFSLQTHTARDFRFAGFKEPHDQDTRVGYWYHFGNFTCGDPRRSVFIRNFI